MVVIKHSKLVEWFFMTGASISLGRFILEFCHRFCFFFFDTAFMDFYEKSCGVICSDQKKFLNFCFLNF